MTRACDLGPGDIWGSPSAYVLRCEHCGIEIEEGCVHDRCAECRDTVECCLECSVCHKFSDGDEFEDDVCIDCAVAAQERAEARIESDTARLEDIGRECYYESKYGDAL